MGRSKRMITYSDFELIFTNYAQTPPGAAVFNQAFVGVSGVVVDEATRTARVRFRQKGQARGAYNAVFNSDPVTGIYDRVVAPFMPGADFESMGEFSQSLGEEMDKARAQRQRGRRK
jgi:hypothetical protein